MPNGRCDPAVYTLITSPRFENSGRSSVEVRVQPTREVSWTGDMAACTMKGHQYKSMDKSA
jgi:hypothetical protein